MSQAGKFRGRPGKDEKFRGKPGKDETKPDIYRKKPLAGAYGGEGLGLSPLELKTTRMSSKS
jgi:hypothetical protein